MPSNKRLDSVCNSIAQHAVSGLSCINPHLRRAAREAGLDSFLIDLCHTDPCPDPFKHIRPLHFSLLGLRDRFGQVLASEGFGFEDVKSMTLLFQFPAGLDDYCVDCKSRMVTKTGRVILHTVNYLGSPQIPKSIRGSIHDKSTIVNKDEST